MTPSKKKLLKPKEVSLEPSLKVATPIVELSNNKNKLFDENDDVGTFTITDLSLPKEDEKEEIKFYNVWEYAINALFKLSPLHAEGKCLREWVKHQIMESMEQFLNGMKTGYQLENPNFL